MAAILSALLIILTGATAAIASSTSANNALSDDGEVDLAPRGQNQKSLFGSTPGKTPSAPTNTPAQSPGMNSWTPGSGSLSSNCTTDWGYNHCTDHLSLTGIDEIDLGWVCSLDSVKFDASFNGYDRGMFTITSLTQTGSSLSINYNIFCGEGTYFEGASHFVDYDYDYGKEGYSLMDFLYDMAEAMGDAHEPPGYIPEMVEWKEEELERKYAAKKALEEWRATHSEQDVDPDADDDTDTDDDDDNSDADDDDTPSLHDGDGCPEDDPTILC